MTALLVIDVQNDFLPGGTLAVPFGNEVIEPINKLLKLPFDVVVACQDYHPKDHISFASSHKKIVGDVVYIDGFAQTLWPDHCVQGTKGAEFASSLHTEAFDFIVKKDDNERSDTYSAFYGKKLSDYLRKKNVKNVVVAGLALDWCVKCSALDSVKEGFETIVVADACRAVNLHAQDGEKAIKEMEKKGVKICILSDLLKEASSFLSKSSLKAFKQLL